MTPNITHSPRKADFDMEALSTDREHVLPILYAYDYIPKAPRYVERPPPALDFENPCLHEIDKSNSILLKPISAKLPWHSGLPSVYQNKHWEINVKRTEELLSLFVQDSTDTHATGTSEQAVFASFAKAEVDMPSLDRYNRFTTYMFPDANSRRMELLAQIILFIFIFDDTWEEADSKYVQTIRDDFISRINGNVSKSMLDSPLQQRIANVRLGFIEEDKKVGEEVIAAFLDFCRHPHPENHFASLREYLNYRHDDVAMPFLYSCAKFSIGSDVDLTDKKLHYFLSLMSDHFSIVNDIASFDKEYRNFKLGRAKHLINAVAVVQELYGLPDSDAAKSILYAFQLWTEQAIFDELKRMKVAGELSSAQWKYVDSVLNMAAGNVFTSVVIPRYGGDAARVML